MLEEVVVTDTLIRELARTVTKHDRTIIRKMTGKTVQEALRDSVANATECSAWLKDGKIVAIIGIRQVHFLSPWAWPWMVCNNIARSYPVQFVKMGKWWVKEKVKRYGMLSSYIVAEDAMALRWNKALGFDISEPQELTPGGQLVVRSTMVYVP